MVSRYSWFLALTWLVGGALWAVYRDQLPSGLLWGLLALIAWWLVGGASKEGRQK